MDMWRGFEKLMVPKLEIMLAHGQVEEVRKMMVAHGHAGGVRKWTCGRGFENDGGA